MTFVSPGDHPTVEMLPGITRTVIASGERAMVVRFELEKDAVLPDHSHPHEQMGLVISGALELTVAGETRTLQAGASYVAPANSTHSAIAVERSIVVDVFSPPRVEYL
jgi:quercetin dioxygenase-like cupin family protein